MAKDRGLTQNDLVDGTLVAKASINKYWHGTGEPRSGRLDKLATFFGMSIDYLVRGTESSGPMEVRDAPLGIDTAIAQMEDALDNLKSLHVMLKNLKDKK